jgi:hypothetical protein
MLEMRPSCERCDKDLPADGNGAMICSFECTFCAECVRDVLSGICPNCGLCAILGEAKMTAKPPV